MDESRRRRVTQTFNGVEDALEHTARFYRRSALQQVGDYLEIWCEKDALAGVMWDPASDYDVPLMVSRGMPSITFLHGTALEIARAARAGKRTYIYQFGDHDPSGVLIPQTIEAPAQRDVRGTALSGADCRARGADRGTDQAIRPSDTTDQAGGQHGTPRASRATAWSWMRSRPGFCGRW